MIALNSLVLSERNGVEFSLTNFNQIGARFGCQVDPGKMQHFSGVSIMVRSPSTCGETALTLVFQLLAPAVPTVHRKRSYIASSNALELNMHGLTPSPYYIDPGRYPRIISELGRPLLFNNAFLGPLFLNSSSQLNESGLFFEGLISGIAGLPVTINALLGNHGLDSSWRLPFGMVSSTSLNLIGWGRTNSSSNAQIRLLVILISSILFGAPLLSFAGALFFRLRGAHSAPVWVD
jgi:hypothetical protein